MRLAPVFSIDDSSGIDVSLTVDATQPLNFTAAVHLPQPFGDVGIKVVGGTLNVALAGHLGISGATIDGSADLTLPLFLAIGGGSGLPIGGTTQDTDGNGVPDNALDCFRGL